MRRRAALLAGLAALLTGCGGGAAHGGDGPGYEGYDDAIALTQGAVLVASFDAGHGHLAAYPLDGGPPRALGLPRSAHAVNYVTSGAGTVVALTQPPAFVPRSVAIGPPAGPLHDVLRDADLAAMAGTTLVALRENPRTEAGTLLIRPLGAAAWRRIPLPGRRFGVLRADARRISVIQDFASLSRATVLVIDRLSGRIVSRVHARDVADTALLPDGDVLIARSEHRNAWTVWRSSPPGRTRRVVARLHLAGARMVSSGGEVVVNAALPGGGAETFRLDPDTGARTPLPIPGTPENLVVGDGAIAYTMNGCIFALRDAATPRLIADRRGQRCLPPLRPRRLVGP